MPTSALPTEAEQKVLLFLDDATEPFTCYAPPVRLDFNTTRLVDGPHELRVVARSSSGQKGVQRIPFVVRNDSASAVLGLSPDDIVSDVLPLTVTAYGSERTDSFVIKASETPQGVPAWVWASILVFLSRGAYYLFTALSMPTAGSTSQALH